MANELCILGRIRIDLRFQAVIFAIQQCLELLVLLVICVELIDLRCLGQIFCRINADRFCNITLVILDAKDCFLQLFLVLLLRFLGFAGCFFCGALCFFLAGCLQSSFLLKVDFLKIFFSLQLRFLSCTALRSVLMNRLPAEVDICGLFLLLCGETRQIPIEFLEFKMSFLTRCGLLRSSGCHVLWLFLGTTEGWSKLVFLLRCRSIDSDPASAIRTKSIRCSKQMSTVFTNHNCLLHHYSF